MRTQQLKKIQNRPMRSPSPDLVSKSSIKNTEVDTDYVHRYIDNKNGRQSKSPRITNKSLSFQVQ